MSRLTCRVTILFAGVATCLVPSLAQAQDNLNDTVNEEVSRVIRLRSKIDEPLKALNNEVVLPSQQLVENPIAPLLQAPTVAFDEISTRATPMPAPKAPATLEGRVEKDDAPQVQSDFSSTANRTARLIQPAPTKTKPISYRVESARAQSSPIISTEVIAPKNINLNDVAPMRINIQNVGQTTVENIKVFASLPPHVKYENASLTPEIVDGQLIFSIQSLAAGKSTQIGLDITPTEKRSIDIGTRVTVENTQNINVNVRQPQLALRVKGPEQVNLGSNTTHTVVIENIGDGVAQQVRLEADFPGELRFLEQQGMKNVRSLKPGEKVEVTVKSMAQAPGPCQLDFVVSGAGCKAEPASSTLRITQPELKVSAVGPDMNFVERDGIYSISVDNSGEVDVKNVEVVLSVPAGMKVTTISRQAKINSKTGTLSWKFPTLQSKSSETIQLKATATQPGEQVCRILVSSDDTNEKEFALKTVVATRADLSINLNSVGGPVQVGNQAEFSIVVENRGSSVANDIQIQVELPESMRPVNQGNAFVEERENSILFMEAKLEPGKTREFRFQAVGVAKGEHIVRSTLQASGSERRVIAEGSVYVYEPTEARVSESLAPTIPR